MLGLLNDKIMTIFNKLINRKTLLIFFVFVLTAFVSCNSANPKQCEVLYKKAMDNWLQFSITNDSSLLVNSKKYLDSINCKPVKYKVFILKISLFYLLQDYKGGQEYVMPFDSSDFGRDYMKNMYIKSFEAMLCEAQGDIIKRNNLYKEIIAEIQSYLEKAANQETLVDLFAIKSKIETKTEILKEIELLKTTGKYDNYFLNALAEMQNENNENGVTISIE
jgi:hypothetical protein